MSIVSNRHQNFIAGERSLIASEHFTNVVTHQDKVYVTRYDSDQTQVFQHNNRTSPRWRQPRSIDHDLKTKACTLTVSISNNQLKCCSFVDDIIKVYSLSGQLLQTYGTHGHGEAGQLYRPFINDSDDGSVLIADCNNGRLQVMSEQGEFSVLQLEPPVSRPRSAVLFNNHVFATSFSEQTIYKYSC